jgi:archaellum component FlaC
VELTAGDGSDSFVSPLTMMMKDQHNEPATKGDIAELEERIGRVDQRVDRVEKHVVQLSQDLVALKDELQEQERALHEETRRHFDVLAEQLFHQALGAHKDEIESLKDGKADHERRIRRLEEAAGVIAA